MFVSKLMFRAMLAELERRGLKSDTLIPDVTVPQGDFEVPGSWRGHSQDAGVRRREVELLVERAMRQSADPALGLSLGQRAPESMLHVLGHLVLTCNTLREVFAVLQRYATLMLGGMEWYLAERGDVAVFGFSRPEASADTARFFADWLLAFALRIGRQYARDPRGAPLELSLAHPAPTYAQTYRQVFGCPVYFDRPSYGLTFPRVLLDRQQAHADPVLSAVLRQTADDLHRQITGASSFAERVRHALRYEQDLVNMDFDRLASRWGMTRRTLRRRLSAEGQSLSELLDEACCQQAKEELRRQDESIKEIAERLGYSETSAFHRAFKRWTGQTPSEYRANPGVHVAQAVTSGSHDA
jgi:AraC-like DNA-binding protein